MSAEGVNATIPCDAGRSEEWIVNIGRSRPGSCRSSRSRVGRGALLALAFVASTASFGGLQAQDSALGRVLVASVFDDVTGSPIPAAFVAAVEEDRITTTDRNGSFRLESLTPGRHSIRVWRIGYHPTEFSVVLDEQIVNVLDVPVVLEADPVHLPEIVVEDDRDRVLMGPVREFYRRRSTGVGTFVTREEIEARGAERFEELLRDLNGVDVMQVGDLRWTVRMSGGRFNGCSVQFWVDGARVESRWAMAIRPEAIEGLEVYRRLSEVPPEFGSDGLCGVIVIWTRR